jgi:hypothetical protein
MLTAPGCRAGNGPGPTTEKPRGEAGNSCVETRDCRDGLGCVADDEGRRFCRDCLDCECQPERLRAPGMNPYRRMCEGSGCMGPGLLGPVPASPEACRTSGLCSWEGECGVAGGRCVAVSDADCRRSTACRRQARCVVREGRCEVGADEDCRKASICRDCGHCTLHGQECAAAGPDDCRRSAICRHKGQCGPKNGRCFKPGVQSGGGSGNRGPDTFWVRVADVKKPARRPTGDGKAAQ